MRESGVHFSAHLSSVLSATVLYVLYLLSSYRAMRTKYGRMHVGVCLCRTRLAAT